MRRRNFILSLGAATWPRGARAREGVGLLHVGSLAGEIPTMTPAAADDVIA